MRKKHTYATRTVDQVDLLKLIPLLVTGCVIAIDVAKEKFVAALATFAGEVLTIVRFAHPTETLRFLRLVSDLKKELPEGKLVAALEPTGTYGDPLRYRLAKLGVPVTLVSPKATYDSRELFDGVPSLHDGKSAMIIAKLYALGRAAAWPQLSAERSSLRALADERALCEGPIAVAHGRLESMLARHWPEFGCWLDVHEQTSALKLLATFGSPAVVASNRQQVCESMRSWSRARLSPSVVDGVVESARISLGVPMTVEEESLVKAAAASVLEHERRADEVEKRMVPLIASEPGLQRVASFLGKFTTTVLFSHADPLRYGNARAFEKACGLNLKEKSSGAHDGRLSISKRGPSVVRKMLFMAALRLVQSDPLVKAWYEKRKSYVAGQHQCAVVAVMRKLTRALWHVARGADFDAKKLFDARRLSAATEAAPKKAFPASRTTERSAIKSRARRPAKAETPAHP